ncbi:calcium-binding protein [Pseudomonas sp. A34-9]|uniref:calcium-binding protein n=1 Tax=Pseudomonas sp. A34-9 TaxID=3034675 RepID=UPI00240CF611|nr:calcium-binding protein [Pseudomonas sp. A34-9]
MATFGPGYFPRHDPVVITDIGLQANAYTASTLDFANAAAETERKSRRRTRRLKNVDALFGPLQIGSVSITRVALDTLGASIAGKRLNRQNTFFRIPRRSFLHSLQFSSFPIETWMKSATVTQGYLLSSLLFEIASRRPLDAPPVLGKHFAGDAAQGVYHAKLAKLLDSAQKLDLRHASLPKNNLLWVAVKSHWMLGSSVGIQGFGIFMGLRGVVDAVKNDDTTLAVFNGASIAAEFASIAVDIAVTRIATQMIRVSHLAYQDFAKTRFAVRLGRSGGLIGGALTLPFDLYAAVKSLTDAENATGKVAMDHYVSAGLSLTGAAMTVLLGAAAMAGFSFAGPVGLAAGAMLALGAQVYAAVRMVDDIDDYIELTTHERWRTGWFAFCFMDPDDEVMDRYTVAKARIEYSRQLKENAKRWLDGALKDTTQAIVHGSFEVHLEPTRKWTRNWWTRQYRWENLKLPRITGADDTIDARAGVTDATPGAQLGTTAAHKGVLWLLGDGNDSIKGVEKQPNAFLYKTGRKDLTGGEKDDRFVFEGAADLLKDPSRVADYSKLKGGAGNDTLSLGGLYNLRAANPPGYDIDLPAGTLHLVTPDSSAEDGKTYTFRSLIEGIENVETVAQAASTVTGTAQRNIIKSRGFDTLKAGAGDDQLHLLHRGASASGEAGADEYFVAHEAGRISIIEDGKEPSVIVLNWRMDLIESWIIEKCALIITSTFEFHDSPKSVVVIQDVYQQVGDEYRLKNNKLEFMTSDGFYLAPELPECLNSPRAVDVEVVITRQGQTQRPIILYASDFTIAHNHDASYYLPRTLQHSRIHAAEHRDAVTRIYLDYTSDELTRSEARFLARISDKNHDLLIGCDLTYHFGKKTLTFKLFAQARGANDPMNSVKILRTMAAYPKHKYVLIFSDGVAFNARLTSEIDTPPVAASYQMYAFTTWKTRMSLPWEYRSGLYLFELAENEAYQLGAAPACALLSSYPEQTAMENLLGQGATYLIHLAADMTIRIATPGAMADTSHGLRYSSTWEFDASALGDVEIGLEKNQLQIGTCTIHLPKYDSGDLIDRVRVITAKGVVQTVNLSVDRIYFDGLDARFFDPPAPQAQALPEAFAELADKDVKVRNIALIEHRAGILRYSFMTRRWLLDSEVIDVTQLRVLNRCAHQVPLASTSSQLH